MRRFGRSPVPFTRGLRFAFAPVLVAALLTGCGGDEGGPSQVNAPEPIVVPDGTFTVTAQEIYKTCDQPNGYNSDFEIGFDGSTFTMGDDWTGTWDAITGNARGRSEVDEVTQRDCTVKVWTTVNVTFESADDFVGNVTYTRRVNDGGQCNFPCNVTWGITGVRK